MAEPTEPSTSKTMTMKDNNMDTPEHKTLFEAGLEMRKKVLGEDYVAASLEKGKGDFLRPLQQFATESAWGTIWTRPGLSHRDRSLLTLGMLTASSQWAEMPGHIRGAVKNGLTEIEIREIFLQTSAYCGLPAAFEAFKIADRVLDEMEAKGEFKRER